MNIFQDDITREFVRIKELLASGQPLTSEDLKIIVLAEMMMEDSHESKD